MTSFNMLSGIANGSQNTDSTSNVFSKAIQNAGASGVAASTSNSTTETDYAYQQEVMNGMGIGTALDVSV